jgi:hypothetical protein
LQGLAPGLLDNVNNRDNLPLTIGLGTVPGHGEITDFGDDGSFTFVPDEDFVGTDSFTYIVSDELPAVQGVSAAAVVEGTVQLYVSGGSPTASPTTAPPTAIPTSTPTSEATGPISNLPNTGGGPASGADRASIWILLALLVAIGVGIGGVRMRQRR